MKTLSLFFGLLFFTRVAAQQPGVAINTNGNAPHSSAMLDIQSTSKGLLVPSMTTLQRQAIATPAEGLLVFDLTELRMYIRREGIWRYLSDNTLWSHSTTRNHVFNNHDSVGIGTVGPVDPLHVQGDARVVGTFKVVGEAGIGLTAPQAPLHVRTLGNDKGMIIESFRNPIIQLNEYDGSNWIYKGFMMTEDDNMKIGTRLSTGSFIIRAGSSDKVFITPSGNMGVGVSAPTTKLDVNGSINMTGKLTADVTGSESLTPVCYGITSSGTTGGTARATDNVSVTRVSTGHYRIYSLSFTDANRVILVDPLVSGVDATVYYSAPFYYDVLTKKISDNTDIDTRFRFIAY